MRRCVNCQDWRISHKRGGSIGEDICMVRDGTTFRHILDLEEIGKRTITV